MPVGKSVIIVAGGKGLRMGSELPKQFIPLRGLPVLMRTVAAFHEYDPRLRIVVVLAKENHGRWQAMCGSHSFNIPHALADGGETRFHSVRNGLACIGGDGLIGVHDGVRPFASKELIARCYDAAQKHGSAVPALPPNDTVRMIGSGGRASQTLDRSALRLVQTPQVFQARLLRDAYSSDYSPAFTDDASVVESSGHDVFLVEGERRNIKLTTQFDLLVAEAMLL